MLLKYNSNENNYVINEKKKKKKKKQKNVLINIWQKRNKCYKRKIPKKNPPSKKKI